MYHVEMKPEVLDIHYQNVKDFVRTRARVQAENNPFTDSISKDAYNSFIHNLLTETKFYKDEPLWVLICGTPEELIYLYNKNASFFKKLECLEKQEKKQLKETNPRAKYVGRLERIFDYETYCQNTDKIYAVTHKLGVKVCPYCNRSFISTVIQNTDFVDKKERSFLRNNVIRPELDHYFPKSKYPMLALSIYNLIPCCHICNSNIKGRQELNIKEHYHPYMNEPIGIHFSFSMDGKASTRIKILCDDAKAENTVGFFGLDAIYPYHNDESDRLYDIYREYPDEYIDNLLSILQKGKVLISKEKLLNSIYNHYVVDNPDQEILGHLRDDLYKKIKAQYSEK